MSSLKRPGDDGSTGILGEGRLPKYDLLLETLGSLDEASAALGLGRALCCGDLSRSLVVEIQRDLYAMMTELAADPEHAARFRILEAARLQWLEKQADALSSRNPLPSEFILPGESPGSAALALARTTVRRAERRLAELNAREWLKNPILLPYLNRLSWLCFLLELDENRLSGQATQFAKR
jgi:cob(I)alamin adenosyltransferase